MEYVITPHAYFEMRRRGISEEVVHAVLEKPEQGWEIRPDRHVFQSRISLGSPEKAFLIRVFVDFDRHPKEVVTVYRTSKIGKYWRNVP